MKESEQDDKIWRALADPSRRAILDLLRVRPRTTGDLAERFPVSRFAVMKHLEVLVDCGLVLVERRGRQRFNHLHPLPLKRVLRRWVRPLEEASIDRLEHAARALESRLQQPQRTS